MKNFGKWCAFGMIGIAASMLWVIGWRITFDGEWIDGPVTLVIAFALWSLAYSIRPPREVVVVVRNCGTVDVHANGRIFRASDGGGE
ncbi:hypothetical protein [Asaia lannensis]|uniref:hypothetical protein n=1 Tax=Asaia lannensis TaxID=415421 RepID=UPI0038734375